jgi:hypothetical protein
MPARSAAEAFAEERLHAGGVGGLAGAAHDLAGEEP